MDKNKIIEAATKFVQKGQYDKAIKEYVKLLDADPKDSRILQKIGELYQKKGDNAEAANYFLRVGESYSADGFFLKAVAVYKQVLKLDEKRVDVNLKLAELYQQLGLMSDAMAQLQIVSAHYEKAGDSQASLDLLKRMVELDPDNIASRIKLAELYARDNIQTEAVNEFSKAAQYLKRNNRIDDYIKVAERLVFLDPGNVELARELAQIYLAKQDTKRALAKLQVCFKSDPRDVETLTLLAQAFLELGQTTKTVSVYKELAKIYDEQDKVDEERGVWERIRDIAPDDPDVEKHLAPSQPAAAEPAAFQPAPVSRGAAAPAAAAGPLSADQILKLLTETDVYVKYGLHDKALEHLKKVFAADPDNLEGHDKAYLLAKSAGQHGRAEEELVSVIRLGIAAGDHDRARARLQELLEQNPGHPEVAGFLEVLGAAPAAEEVDDSILIESDDAEVLEDAEEMAPEPFDDDALAAAASGDEELLASGDDELLASADEPLAHEETAVEISAISIDDEALLAAAGGDEQLLAGDDEALFTTPESDAAGFELVSSAEDEALAVASSDDEALVSEVGEDLTADEVVAGADDGDLSTLDYGAADLVEASPGSADELVAADEQVFAVPELDGADEPRDITSEQSLLSAEPGERLGSDDSDFESANEGATRVVNLADLAQADEKPTLAKMQVAPPEAVRTGARLPAARPKSSSGDVARTVAAVSDLGVVKAASAGRPAKSETKPAVEVGKELTRAGPKPARPPSRSVSAAPLPVQPAEPDSEDAAGDELEEAAFFISQGDLEEAREILETVLLAFPRNARAKELLGELEAKASASGSADADQSFDLAAELAEELGESSGEAESKPLQPGEDGFQISHDDVFAEFKKGVAKVVKPEDVDTHYDLGIAYKEMGLHDDAVGEFEQAMAGAVGKPREIDCHLAIAACKRDKGDMAGAVETYRKGLSLQQVTAEATKAMLYELATAYEAVGQPNKALASFQKILALDPKYREVASQVSRLEGDGAVPEDEPRNGVHLNGKTGASPGARPPSGGGAGKPASRKIGYV